MQYKHGNKAKLGKVEGRSLRGVRVLEIIMLSRETERERAVCRHQSDQKEAASSGSREVSGYTSKVGKYWTEVFQNSMKKVDFKVSLDKLRDLKKKKPDQLFAFTLSRTDRSAESSISISCSLERKSHISSCKLEIMKKSKDETKWMRRQVGLVSLQILPIARLAWMTSAAALQNTTNIWI